MTLFTERSDTSLDTHDSAHALLHSLAQRPAQADRMPDRVRRLVFVSEDDDCRTNTSRAFGCNVCVDHVLLRFGLRQGVMATVAGIAVATVVLVALYMSSVHAMLAGRQYSDAVGLDGDSGVEGSIMLAHDRKLCLQPTKGFAHKWLCFKDYDATACAGWRTKYFEGLDIRHGWEYKPFPEGATQSPCGCECCRRFLHGRPEHGGGLHVRLWPCSKDDSYQKFILPAQGHGPIRLARFPHRCLTVSSTAWPVGDVGDGHQIMLWLCGHQKGKGQTWILPEEGQGAIRWAQDPDRCVDGGRFKKNEKLEAKLQIWTCGLGGERGPNQLFLLPHLSSDKDSVAVADHESSCMEADWPHRVDNLICGECQVPVRLGGAEHHNSCQDYCLSIGRSCASAEQATSGCHAQRESACGADLGGSTAICRCGPKHLRGHYGFLSDFWLPAELMRQHVREMADSFGILEFQFYAIFEGFSRPPDERKVRWNCALQGRPVWKASIEAAVDEIRRIGGRSWISIHAGSTDPDDEELTRGHWVMPKTDVIEKLDAVYFEAGKVIYRKLRLGGHESSSPTYEETCGCDMRREDSPMDPEARLMDVVEINAAWALRFVPAWAEFAARLGVSGIHWHTFGDFGHLENLRAPTGPWKGAPKPDMAGFLRAALPILQKHGLVQTLNFVDGYGWDPALLEEDAGDKWSAQGGRAVAFPYWEVWTPHVEETFYETVGKHRGFVLSMYPGYSKFHCCAKNEQQNAAEYGVWPFDLGLRRWHKAIEHGGTYSFIVDGARYVQGPFTPDAVRFGQDDVSRIQKLVHPGGNHSFYIYAVSSQGSVYRQPLLEMTVETDWTRVSGWDDVKISSITIDAGTIYAVNFDGQVVSQRLDMMTPNSPWTLAATGSVRSIAVHGDTMYGVTFDKKVVRQRLSAMTAQSYWEADDEVADLDLVSSISISNNILFAVTEDNKVVQRKLHQAGDWQTVSAPAVTSVAAFGDALYASGSDGCVFQKRSSKTDQDATWQRASKNDIEVRSIAIFTRTSF